MGAMGAEERKIATGEVITEIMPQQGRSHDIFNKISDLTRLPSKEHLKWQQTRKVLAFECPLTLF